MKPKLRFPEFTHDWFEATLQEDYDYKNAKAHEPFVVQNGKYKLINSKFISTEGKIFKTVDSVLTKGSVGDVTMVLSDLPNGKALAKAYYIEEDDTYAINQRICRLRVLDTHKNDSKFFYYLINRNSYFLKFDDGVSQTHLSKGDVLNFSYYNTQLKEQARIRDLFNCVDQKINLLTKKKQAFEAYKKGLMQKIFSQELRFKREDDTDYPDWDSILLGEISRITIGEFVIKTKQRDDGQYPVFNGGQNPTGYYDEYNNEGNKIVISARGASAGFVNFQYERYWAGNSCYSLSLTKPTYNIRFFYHYLKAYQRRFTDYQQAANIPSVSKKDVQLFRVIVPSAMEQNRITKCLDALQVTIENVESQLQLGLKLKKGLLQQMFV